jgi:nitrite reductase/ring-hydroxylating ferredoxin subunit
VTKNSAETAPRCALPLREVVAGGARRTTTSGLEILAVSTPKGPRVYSGLCPHLGGPLLKGRVKNGTLICPWHGYRFDLRTGSCLTPPGRLLNLVDTKKSVKSPPFPLRLTPLPFRQQGDELLVEDPNA